MNVHVPVAIGPDLQFSKILIVAFSAAQDVLSHINCVFVLHRSHAVTCLLHQISCCRQEDCPDVRHRPDNLLQFHMTRTVHQCYLLGILIRLSW